MPPGEAPERRPRPMNRTILTMTLLFVLLALAASSALVVYTAWLHDLKNGALATGFAVLSAQITLNWFLWKEEDLPEN